MHNQRRIFGIKRNEFITNDEVARCIGLQDKDIATLRKIWLFGHIAQLPLTIPASLLLSVSCAARDGYFQGPDWRRPSGRPCITWVHHICSDTDLLATDAYLFTQDCPSWRAVATVCGLAYVSDGDDEADANNTNTV